ncbi:MAG: AraC family transcriptional regulator [Gluconobacter oxydans]|uniref:AraC family transcriptional regulator n=1 Tax=Gluconobacter oxydans TaxID=442 RepID=UPI0039EBA941
MNIMQKDWIHLRRDRDTGIESVHAHFSGHAYDPHTHDELLVGVTLRGVQQFNCRRSLHTSTQGSAMLIEPGVLHDGHAPSGYDFTYIMLSLPQAWVCGMLQQRKRVDLGVLGATFQDTLVDSPELSAAIIRAFEGLQGQEGRLARGQRLERLIDLLSQCVTSDPVAVARECTGALMRARDYLHDYIDTDITLDELASVSGIDRFRLTRQFGRHFGLSPHAYLVRLRLRKAKKMLADGIRPVEVAARTGFSDQSHMGRWFKRAYRLTPLAYQQSCTNVLYRGSGMIDDANEEAKATHETLKVCSTPKLR